MFVGNSIWLSIEIKLVFFFNLDECITFEYCRLGRNDCQVYCIVTVKVFVEAFVQFLNSKC